MRRHVELFTVLKEFSEVGSSYLESENKNLEPQFASNHDKPTNRGKKDAKIASDIEIEQAVQSAKSFIATFTELKEKSKKFATVEVLHAIMKETGTQFVFVFRN